MVLCLEEHAERLPDPGPHLVIVAVKSSTQALLEVPHCERRIGRDSRGECPGFIKQRLVRHDLQDETDLVGEVCLLAFTAAQTRNTGVLAMALLGAFSIRLPRLQGQRLMLDAARRAPTTSSRSSSRSSATVR